ncbi:hypothetical protein Tco_0896146 [Tanacetum coccineum]
MRIIPTETELALEQSQQGVSYEVSRSTRSYQFSHSEIVDIEKVAVRSSLRLPNKKLTRTASAAAKPYQGDSFEIYLITGFPTVVASSPCRVKIQDLMLNRQR